MTTATHPLPKLQDLTDTYARLIECEDEEEFAQALADLQDMITEKAVNCARVIKTLETYEDVIDEEIKRLKARKESFGKRREWLRRYTVASLLDAGMKGWKSATYTLTVMAGRKRLEVTAPLEIPECYVTRRVVRDIDTAAVKKALEAGEELPGAALVDGDPYLVVR